MKRNIIIIAILLIAEIALGYYSLFINGSLFSKFLFFVLNAAIVSFMVINGIQYILPSEDEFHDIHNDED